MKIEIHTLIGENCITLNDGERVYDILLGELTAGREVEVDFSGVSVFASPFFNAAFGRLLKDYTPEILNRLVKVKNITAVGLDVLKRVIENARAYYDNPALQKAMDDLLTDKSST